VRGTVDSPSRARRKRRYTVLFFVGAFMVAAAVMLTFPALQYGFQQGAGGEPSGEGATYEYLTDEEQRVVDGALNGTAYTFETSQPLPGTPNFALEPTQLEVTKDGTTHTFTYWMIFPATEPMGLVVLGLASGGLFAMVEAVRRRHFPDSLPW